MAEDSDPTPITQMDVHIPSCFRTSCKTKMKTLCTELESRHLRCILEQRGDYLKYNKSGLMCDTFKLISELTLKTIFHVCPQMITRFKSLSEQFLEHSERFIFIITEDTPEEMPDIILSMTTVDLSDDAHYSLIADNLAAYVLEKRPLKPTPDTKCEDGDSTQADYKFGNIPGCVTHEYDFVTVPGISNDDPSDVYALPSCLDFSENTLLKWSTDDECNKLSASISRSDIKSHNNTLKCLLGRVLPRMYDQDQLTSVVMFLKTADSKVKKLCVKIIEVLLLKMNIRETSRMKLEKVEQLIYNVLSSVFVGPGDSPPTSLSSPLHEYSEMCSDITRNYLILLSCCGMVAWQQREHHLFEKTLEMITARKQNISTKGSQTNDFYISLVEKFVRTMQGRCEEVAAITEQSLTDVDADQAALRLSKRSWPIIYFVAIAILNEFYQRPHVRRLQFLKVLIMNIKPKGFKFKSLSTKNVSFIHELIMHALVNFLNYRMKHFIGTELDMVWAEVTVILKLIFQSIPGHQMKYYKQIQSLIFHKNTTIRSMILPIFECNQMNTLFAHQVQCMLTPCLVEIDQTRSPDTKPMTRWNVCSAVLGTERSLVHFHIPSEYDHVKFNKSGATAVEDTNLNELKFLKRTVDQKHILTLFAFIETRTPQFYLTEDYLHNNLQSLLKNKSFNRQWFPTTTLIGFLLDILDAVSYLHRHEIIHRDLTAASVFLVEEKQTVKLAQFYLARECCQEKHIAERDCALVPTRWTAPESLSQFIFSAMSDMWMVGNLMYEILTHGCLPYSDLKNKSDNFVVEKVILGRKRLYHEKRINDGMFELMMECTTRDVDQRPSAEEVKAKLQDEQEKCFKQDANKFDSPRSAEFPDLKNERTPSTDMLRGIPRIFVNDDDTEFDGYENTTPFMTMCIPPEQECEDPYEDIEHIKDIDGVVYINNKTLRMSTNCRTLSMFHPENHMQWTEKNKSLLFNEKCTRLGRTEFSALSTEQLPGIPTKKTVVNDGLHDLIQYYLPNKTIGSLRGVCLGCAFGDETLKYVECLQLCAKTLLQLHARGWIHGDICAENVWIVSDGDDLEILFVGLSNMHHQNELSSLKPSILTDRRKITRAAPEVLKDGIVSTASDIFSFGIMMWEVSNMIGQIFDNPVEIEDRILNPLFDVKEVDMYDHLTTSPNNAILPKPPQCSDDLYQLMLTCWCSERNSRQSLVQLVNNLGCYISYYSNKPMDDVVDGDYISTGYSILENQEDVSLERRTSSCEVRYSTAESSDVLTIQRSKTPLPDSLRRTPDDFIDAANPSLSSRHSETSHEIDNPSNILSSPFLSICDTEVQQKQPARLLSSKADKGMHMKKFFTESEPHMNSNSSQIYNSLVSKSLEKTEDVLYRYRFSHLPPTQPPRYKGTQEGQGNMYSDDQDPYSNGSDLNYKPNIQNIESSCELSDNEAYICKHDLLQSGSDMSESEIESLQSCFSPPPLPPRNKGMISPDDNQQLISKKNVNINKDTSIKTQSATLSEILPNRPQLPLPSRQPSLQKSFQPLPCQPLPLPRCPQQPTPHLLECASEEQKRTKQDELSSNDSDKDESSDAEVDDCKLKPLQDNPKVMQGNAKVNIQNTVIHPPPTPPSPKGNVAHKSSDSPGSGNVCNNVLNPLIQQSDEHNNNKSTAIETSTLRNMDVLTSEKEQTSVNQDGDLQSDTNTINEGHKDCEPVSAGTESLKPKVKPKPNVPLKPIKY